MVHFKKLMSPKKKIFSLPSYTNIILIWIANLICKSNSIMNASMIRIVSPTKIMSLKRITLSNLIEWPLSKFKVYDILYKGKTPIYISLIMILKLKLLFVQTYRKFIIHLKQQLSIPTIWMNLGTMHAQNVIRKWY